MDIASLKRNAAAINEGNLKELPDGSLVTLKGCVIHIPSRYLDKGLASLGNETYICAFFAISDDKGNYGVSKATAMMRIDPISQSKYTYKGEEFIAFEFPAGSVVVPDTQLVVQSTLLYNIYAYFIGGGSIPWFMDYEQDVLRMFDTDELHAGSRLVPDRAIFHMIAATIARYHADKTKYYRQSVESRDTIVSVRPEFVAFKSVIYGPKSTASRLMGNYYDQAVATALVNPADGHDEIEVLLRS